MDESRTTSYDEVSYPSFPIYFSHPDRLATIATLFGMKPAPPEQCRVLEIGCFDGTNLSAMAVGLPQSEFVGVDVAGTAIARGSALAAEAGLRNVSLRHLDLMDMAPDFGTFDYIVAHGVYSWVPEMVRKQTLAICKGSLAPQGVAYVSYNTLPGCHTRLMLREMMLFHNRDFASPQQKMQQGLNLLKLLANSLEKEFEPYTSFLKGELERLTDRSLESLYHDELAEVFAPLYFHQFMDEARRHDLQFLGEADYFDMMPRGLTPKAVEVLDSIKDDIVLREQYLDFMRGRHFRKTLLCHADVPLDRAPKFDCVRSHLISMSAKTASPSPSFEAGAQDTFEGAGGAKVTTGDPLGRALFWYLKDREPERIPFPRLATEVETKARQDFGFDPRPGQDVASDLANSIWVTYCAGLLEMHLHNPPFVVHVSEKPIASPLARSQARRSYLVSTLHHRSLRLGNSIQRGLTALLDGSRDRSTLRADLLQVFETETLDLLDGDGKPIRDMCVVGKAIDAELEVFLDRASRTALLMV
jgi:hypothetical protein